MNLMMVERLFLAVPRGCLQFVIVVFPDHTHLLFWSQKSRSNILKILGIVTLTTLSFFDSGCNTSIAYGV